ncbi:MAG: alpha-2-macroglobulin family protein, partial [Pyrinomonadaceae bacterium]
LKTTVRQALAYFCDALTGAPLRQASVRLWERVYQGKEQRWSWREYAKQTNEDGIAVFPLASDADSRDHLFAAASADDAARQAFSAGYSYSRGARSEDQWRIYAFTDRPAYRPQESVQWKFIARRQASDGAYTTPANQIVEYEIADPRGTKVKDGKATLNGFGSAWGSLELTEASPLGEYRVAFWTQSRERHIGNATLFRLEEYKLPEFKVAIKTPEENGKRKAFRLGEKVEVKVQADYYFGGPVANGTAEVVVYQRPFHHWWRAPREFEWYYEDLTPQYGRHYGGGGPGQIVKRETLKLDPTGAATLTFDTPRASGRQDFEFRVEARVTDASRREIVANEAVRVTRQRYYVYPRAAHQLYRPQDKVTVDIKALDANSQPVETEGRVKVTRDYWYEIWLDPQGREVKGEELRALRGRHKVFPPPVDPKTPGSGWRLKFRGYQHDEILTRAVKTDAQGEAEFDFTPEREGFYRVAWTSPDGTAVGAPPVRAETTVWVATGATTELGYRHGGLEIIADKDTFRAGERAPVLLHAPANGRYVLFSVEGADLYSYQLVHLTGDTKLIEVPIEERHVPNVYLSATMVSDREIYYDQKQVVVPPVRQFLNVEVRADRDQYRPREEGTLWVTAKDQVGRPVAAEVALGLVDESVFYIQQLYAPDPRRFFYGDKRGLAVQNFSTFQQKRYANLVEGADKNLIEVKEAGRNEFRVRKDGADDEIITADGSVTKREIDNLSMLSAGATRSAAESVAVTDQSVSELPVNNRAFSRLQMIADLSRPPSAAPVPAAGQEPAVQVRSDFRSTVFWQPDVVTGADGTASVKVKYPDSLTGWQATARVATAGNQFGTASAATRTKQPLIARLQAPRFFVAGDETTLSAVINNNTDAPARVTLALAAEGVTITGYVKDGRAVKGDVGPVEVPAQGEARVDWIVRVESAGAARLKLTARGAAYADAMERSYAVYEHGLEKLVTKSGKLRGSEAVIKLNIPRERRPETTRLDVQVAPSMAVTMLDALPYLIDYPYGCTEQTMSRFLPAAITAKTLRALGLRPEDAMAKVFGGVEPESAARTHPQGKKDLRELDRMVKQGLERLYDFQHADGGWGWWKEGESDHFMTAYVVWGFALARDAGIEIRNDALARAVAYLDKELVEEESNFDNQAWMLHALAAQHASTKRAEVSPLQSKAFENLWAGRDRLNAYTRALLALSAHYYGLKDRARTLVENLENGVKVDRAPDTSVVLRGEQQSQASVVQTAHWGEDGVYWRWSDGGVEATAFALRALLAIDPRHRLVEPVTNWLVRNRRGAQWSNTRDTAITVLTLNDYLRAGSSELQTELEYELLINGQLVTTRRVTPADALSAPSRFAVSNSLIRDGDNEIVVRRKGGGGPVYFAAEARFFSLEEPLTATGNEIFVRRQYYKLVPRATLLKGYVYDRVPLGDGERVASGERVEVILTVEAKNNYEYLLFEDLKPAGLEAVEVRSGQSLYARELKSGAVARRLADGNPEEPSDDSHTGRERWVYQELRDRKVALFLDRLPEGVWQIRYDLRAETPGRFHALPVTGHAMYVPEIRANGEEQRIMVEDKQ